MKNINKLITLLIMFVSVLALSACSKDVVPEIRDVKSVALRTSINIDFVIWDEDGILDSLTLTLTGKVNGESYEKVENITISGGDYATEDDLKDGVELEDFIGESESISFNSLDTEETYTIVFTGVYNDRSRKMHTVKSLTTSDKGSQEKPHEIKTVDDFEIVRNDTDGYFKLMNNIDCDGKEVEPFYSSSKKFEGNFDGGNFTISNFYQSSFTQYMGLFGYIGEEGIVKDLNINDAKVTSKRFTGAYVGGFAGRNSGEITNVNLTDIEITTEGPDDGFQYVGGFVGYNKAGVIKNSNVTNVKFKLNVPGDASIGGFVGASEMSNAELSEIDNCDVINADLSVMISNKPGYTSDDTDVELELSVGGFVGDNRSVISNSNVEANVSVFANEILFDDYAKDPADRTEEAKKLARHNLIEDLDLYVGGFAGKNLNGGKLLTTTADVSIKVDATFVDKLYLGGFVGYNDFFSFVDDCSFTSKEFDVFFSEDSKFTYIPDDSSKSLIGNDFGINASFNNNSFASNGSITFNFVQYKYVEKSITDNGNPYKAFVYEYTNNFNYPLNNN